MRMLRLFLLATYLLEAALGLSSSFRIVGMAGTGTQLLPESYVRSFARWTVEEQGLLQQHQQQKITSSSLNHASATGTIQIRPTLDILVKGGTPAYVMAGLQVAHILQDASRSTISPTHLAQQWTTFASAVEPNFRIVIYQGAGDGTDERVLLIGNDIIRKILENLGNVLSRSEATQFAEGFHILSFPAATEWTDLDASIDGVLSCMATAESDSRELLSLDQDLLELTVTSLLQIPLSDLGEAV